MKSMTVVALSDGTIELLHEFEGGGEMIRCLPNGTYEVYEIMTYGKDMLIGTYQTFIEARRCMESLT